MTDRWSRIEALFDGAVELAPAERAAFLDRECAGDAELRAEVASLLDNASGEARESLRGAVANELDHISTAMRPSMVGQRLGPYRIVALVAEGGMGEVFLAERDDAEFEKKVAIKVLRGFGSSDLVARFRDERRILAALDHPNIVRLIDGGTTDDGMPFLVMDYIEGVPITRYARAHDLPVRERVAMFMQVCAAVQYAHQNLVVHRDLKPSNILVGADGKPQLLDFGIAKLLDPVAGASREAKTGTNVRLLTPEYASPEQARGEPVTVATDVYSLGNLLYELLADRPAIAPATGGLELLRAICEVDAPRPSTTCPPDRRRAIAGDLDNIVAKSLHKLAVQRYASVVELAADLDRYLAGKPVVARTATLRYRAGKFARRHWGKIALAGVASLALAGSTAVSLVQARRANEQAARAERRFDELRALAHSLVFEVDPRIRDLKGATAARELVVRRALEYLDRLGAESGGDVDLAREVAQAYMRVGDIQDNLYDPNLGRPEDALASYAKARQILARLPDDDATRAAKAAAAFGVAFLDQVQGRGDDTGRELALARSIVATLPDDKIDYPLVARGYTAAAQRDLDAADLASAERDQVVMATFMRRWRARDSGPDARYWSGIASDIEARNRTWLADPDQALVADRAALVEFDQLAADYPNEVRYARERALLYWFVGGALAGTGDNWDWTPSTGDAVQGEIAAHEAFDIVHQITERDPDDVRALYDEGTIGSTYAAIVADRSPAESIPLFEHVLATWDRVPAAARSIHYALQLEFFAHCAMAVPLAKLGRADEAREQVRRGMAILAREPGDALADERASCLYETARAEHALGNDDEAIARVDELIASYRPEALKISRYIGVVRALELRAAVRPGDACTARAQIAATWRSWQGPETPYVRRVRAGAPDCKR
ncbi:MAG TPA: serine/threonine-protein kinase [Kofleriaceae bacterium]|jgi:hypothetical protein